ncbi:MAG: alanine racemase [Sphingosinicella sp.]|uniref:alanine racemase n=1 Tax=Sphingosinicella sp. TaxID=1917971 RepID=UPI004037868B
MRLTEAATPALILDRGKFRHNCERMLAKARSLGTRLRPHMKTLKSIDAARVAIDPNHGGIAVSTLKEAEYFAGHGIADLQYAVCITPDKLPQAAAIAVQAPGFSAFIDSVEMAEAVAGFVRAGNPAFGLWIEIDSGEHRTGLAPDDDRLIQIAAILESAGVPLAGAATHGGHSYGERTPEGIAGVAEQERLAVVSAAERLRAAGFAVPGVSAGSTPTSVHRASADGLTELRAGVYMVGDLFQSGIGSLAEDEIAVSVLASVIAHNPERNQIVVDAGGLALSKDRSTAALADGDLGFGLVLDIEGEPSLGRLTVAGVSQEHGEIRGAAPLPFDRLPIGARVRILPNHVCMTAAIHDRYLVVDEGAEIVARCDKIVGW